MNNAIRAAGVGMVGIVAFAPMAAASFDSSGDLSDGATRTGHLEANPANPETGSGIDDPSFWGLWTFTVNVTSDVSVDVTRLVPELDPAAVVYSGDATGLDFSAFPAFGANGALSTFDGGFADDTDPNPFGTTDGDGNPLYFGDPRIEFRANVNDGVPRVYSVFVANFAGGFLAGGYGYEITVSQEAVIPTGGSVSLLAIAGLFALGRRRGHA